MHNRWIMLAVLFAARTAMGFQFQSVAATSNQLIETLAIDYAVLGTLIGLFMLPGIVMALPSGYLAGRFGDKAVALLGIILMVIGGVIMALADGVMLAGAGRVIAGIGAVLFNVVTTKMVIDWFVGREIASAMAILVASWPLGIGAALLSLGALAQATSLTHALLAPPAFCAVTAILVALVYRSPAQASPASSPDGQGARQPARLSAREFWLVCLAGLIWTAYNSGYIIVLSFAPDHLSETGFSTADAGPLISIVAWVLVPASPLLGALAERINRPYLIMAGSFALTVAAIAAMPVVDAPISLLLFFALAFSASAGLIMALPGALLQPQNRAVGTGIFFTWYYIGMAALPPLAGLGRDMTGQTLAPVLIGGLILATTLIWLALLRIGQAHSNV